MLSLMKLSRSQTPNLNELNVATRSFNKLWGQSMGYHALVFPMFNNRDVVVCIQQKLKYCTKTPEIRTPNPGQEKPRKASFREKLRPAHSVALDDEPRVTEHMISEVQLRGGRALTFQEKVKETTKTAGYTGIVLVGLSFLVAVGYTMLQELFGSDSPNNIYTKSFKLVRTNTEVQDALGLPIKCHGEETRRGWRRHVLHHEFLIDNVKYLRMKFYLKGKFRNATVTLEKKANEKGKYDKYTFLLVELDGYPSRQILIDTDDM